MVIPSDPEQPEVLPEQQGSGPLGSRDRITLVGPVASPVTSLPRTLGRDILLTGDAEESPRTKEGRVAAATLEQEMGRRSVAAAIRPIKDQAVASSSSAAEPITQNKCRSVLNASSSSHRSSSGRGLAICRNIPSASLVQ